MRGLERAALAAWSGPPGAARPAQYTSVRTVGHSASLSEGRGGAVQRGTVDESAEARTAVDGSRPSLRRTAAGERQTPAPGRGTVNSPTYALLCALPTDPAARLAELRAEADRDHGAGSGSTTGTDQEAFAAFGDLLRTAVAPSAAGAAPCRPAGRVRGGERREWGVDRTSLRLLGERTVLVEHGPWGRAGDEVSSIAVVARGVVDAPGRVGGGRTGGRRVIGKPLCALRPATSTMSPHGRSEQQSERREQG
ncbi:hypothetical protein [Kitasatospora sp. DSM 101779]|uniref:hypothetical protein n=1 Tax=Kitasatospora sp. DSM 101779 TaxID=2853165 RepID=UPI0021DAC424|nr:hypothetical protein [Kitasatospora sp. DSM 101779]MCU7820564.1 hypothetical protein [Kitasatospora sp. DSM 101779]